MRACWLKWVGRDWSISADYIWLNYSGANNEEKLRRWKRKQALFMQRSPEFFLNGDPWLGPNLSAESEYFSL